MSSEVEFYELTMDRLFAISSQWKHRTLRTEFDPLSHEWTTTDFDQKLAIIKKIATENNPLRVILQFKARYTQNNRKDIAESVESALIEILQQVSNKLS